MSKKWYISIVFGTEASTKRIKRRKELSHKQNIAVQTSNFNHRILYFRVTQNMYDNVEDHIIVKTHNNKYIVMFLKQSFSS
jgi:hypothetical protein